MYEKQTDWAKTNSFSGNKKEELLQNVQIILL
jgi:hypothetical protein